MEDNFWEKGAWHITKAHFSLCQEKLHMIRHLGKGFAQILMMMMMMMSNDLLACL